MRNGNKKGGIQQEYLLFRIFINAQLFQLQWQDSLFLLQ